MNFRSISIIASALIPAALAYAYFSPISREKYIPLKTVQSLKDLKKLFPKTVQEIKDLVQQALEEAQSGIKEIISIPVEQKTKENTLYAYDDVAKNFSQAFKIIELLTLVCPDNDLLEEANKQMIILQKTEVELFSQNKQLFDALNLYAQHKAAQDNLDSEEKYFLNNILEKYVHAGLNLPDEKRQQVIAIEKALAELTTEFKKNMQSDSKTIQVTLEELAGLDEDFINNLKKSEDGLYILGSDYPTYMKVMNFCSVNSTRKQMYHIFTNRGYPENDAILNKLIEVRHKLAQLLNFTSYAHLNIAHEMAKTPENVDQFLEDLLKKAHKKEEIEYQQLIKNLPSDVTLSPEGKIYAWDRMYLVELYKKDNFNIDENSITDYFPMDHTIAQLLDIYEQFFAIKLKEEKIDGLWHPDVKLLSVYQNDTLHGYILLDLHPRPNKYHHACQTTIIPGTQRLNNIDLGVVIANFPKSTATQPSLLKRTDVKTFFHEFGHALHSVLGRTNIALLAGTAVKMDFVEMPSQMLEEWLCDKAILKKISCHYKTGESLSDEIIETLIDSKNISSGNDLQKQLWISYTALNFFDENVNQDIHQIFKTLHEKTKPHDVFYDDCHWYASIVHLTDYGAKYYSYLWSKVFALDLFDTIKKHGLLNPEIGVKYKNTILAQGGSKDPNELLFDFLGRKPNSDAFMRDLGL